MPSYCAVADLPDALAARLVGETVGHPLRVAIDGPQCADPSGVAAAVVGRLRARGRFAAHVRAETFWRDASLRLEHGPFDVAGFADWLDAEAVTREVLRPLGSAGSASYLPSLRDPSTNRATREPAVAVPDSAIVLISGGLLLGGALSFDTTIHLAVGAAARRRRTTAKWAWTLPAFDAYDSWVRPVQTANVVVRYDDPAHPAISR